MAKPIAVARRRARLVLGGIRLFNGAATLLLPETFGKRLGVDPDENPAAVYVMRLFGVRTVYLGAELLMARGDHLRHAVRVAPLVHLSDTVSAVRAGSDGQLSKKSARTAVIISGANTVLALLALSEPRSSGLRLPWIR
jgi:hypothetical protein